MGKILSKVTREVKTYNIEQRTHKIISKEKPTPAPLHPSTLREIEQLTRDNPSAFSEQQKKHEILDQNLKDIYVVSHDPPNKLNTSLTVQNSNRSLPERRRPFLESEYGYVEPEQAAIPAGKFTLKQALKILADHQTEPEVHTAEAIAKQYKLDQKLAENILKYYSLFGVRIPSNKEQEKIVEEMSYTLDKMTLQNLPDVLKHEKEQAKMRKIKESSSKSGNVT